MTAPRFLPVAALLLSAAACGEPPPRPPAPGPEARKAVDAATADYAACVEDGARNAPPGQVPGTVMTKVLDECSRLRTALADSIVEFHRIGHPTMTEDQLRAVANASIFQIQPQITAAGVVAYVERTSPDAKAE